MANNLAKEFSPRVVERFHHVSVLDGLFTAEYKWDGVSSVTVYTNDALPIQDYDPTAAAGTSRYGTRTEVGDTVQEMIVSQNKAIYGSMDATYNTQEKQIKKSHLILKQTTDETLTPFIDKYCLDKLSKEAGTTTTAKQAITNKNIVAEIFAAGAAMSEARVPRNNRVIYMSYTTHALLKNAPEVINLESAGMKAIIEGVTETIDGMQIVCVPSDLMPTKVAFMIVRKGVACCPMKIKTLKIVDGGSNLDGHEIVGHLLFDCFVLKTKNKGVYVVKENGAP